MSKLTPQTQKPLAFAIGILCGLAAIFLLIAGLLFAQPTYARESVIDEIASAWNTHPQSAPPASIEVGFSPVGGAQELILKAIATAKSSIHVLAYSFTSKPVASALLAAHKRAEHSIQHNKVLIIDQQHVQTGSYNYSSAAARSNAENAIVTSSSGQIHSLPIYTSLTG